MVYSFKFWIIIFWCVTSPTLLNYIPNHHDDTWWVLRPCGFKRKTSTMIFSSRFKVKHWEAYTCQTHSAQYDPLTTWWHEPSREVSLLFGPHAKVQKIRSFEMPMGPIPFPLLTSNGTHFSSPPKSDGVPRDPALTLFDRHSEEKCDYYWWFCLTFVLIKFLILIN